MQSYCQFEAIEDDLQVSVISQFGFNNYLIEEIKLTCTEDNLKIRFWKGRDRLTVYLYSNIPIGINNVIQVKYEDFIAKREGKINGEIHRCFSKSAKKICSLCCKTHWGGYNPRCKWGETCERITTEFASSFLIPEGSIPYPKQLAEISYKP